jgi:hypothetical protein
MKTKIFLAALIAVSVMLFNAPAHAEVGTQSFGITNTIGAALTNTSAANCGSAVYVGNQDNCALVFTAYGNGAGTSNVTFNLARSMDGTVYETSPTLTWTVAAPGLSSNVYFTNISVGAAGYLKVAQVTSANSTTLTNCSLTLGKKTVKAAP